MIRSCAFVFAVAVCWIAVPTVASPDRPRPWKGHVIGVGDFSEFVTDDDDNVIGRVDVDTIVGRSTHLGRFTVSPEDSCHILIFADLTFYGQAVWRAANGDKLFLCYEGYGFPNTDPDTMDAFPVAAAATFTAVGGTGRFENASGEMTIDGAFTLPELPTDPIHYFFDFDGRLSY